MNSNNVGTPQIARAIGAICEGEQNFNGLKNIRTAIFHSTNFKSDDSSRNKEIRWTFTIWQNLQPYIIDQSGELSLN